MELADYDLMEVLSVTVIHASVAIHVIRNVQIMVPVKMEHVTVDFKDGVVLHVNAKDVPDGDQIALDEEVVYLQLDNVYVDLDGEALDANSHCVQEMVTAVVMVCAMELSMIHPNALNVMMALWDVAVSNSV